jgi:hypothetical protein
MVKRGCTYLTIGLAFIVNSCGEPEHVAQTATSRPAVPSEPKVVEFAPGLRIDYRVPQVEVDGEVVLREGALELFAYSKAPTPKEHESIVILRTPPHSIYQALGLIGLTPGHPMKYLPEAKKIRPPTGDVVDVFVRYKKKGRIIEESACDWMIDVEKKLPMARTHWLFTGSERLEDGSFTADIEGTVVTVVDFDSSILAMPDLHSESDSELWLKANTAAIPGVGTSVTLILRPATKS